MRGFFTSGQNTTLCRRPITGCSRTLCGYFRAILQLGYRQKHKKRGEIRSIREEKQPYRTRTPLYFPLKVDVLSLCIAQVSGLHGLFFFAFTKDRISELYYLSCNACFLPLRSGLLFPLPACLLLYLALYGLSIALVARGLTARAEPLVVCILLSRNDQHR